MAGSTEFPLSITQKAVDIGRMRHMAGITGMIRKRRMLLLISSVADQRRMAGEAERVSIILEQHLLRRGVGLVTVVAFAGFERHMHVFLDHPGFGILVTGGAQIDAVGLGQMIKCRTMRYMAGQTGAVGEGRMGIRQRQHFFFFGMAIEAQIPLIFGDQFGFDLSVSTVAKRAIVPGRFMS